MTAFAGRAPNYNTGPGKGEGEVRRMVLNRASASAKGKPVTLAGSYLRERLIREVETKL